jgi:arylsulfatase
MSEASKGDLCASPGLRSNPRPAVVSEDYGPRGNEFNGEVNWVQIDLDEAAEDLDHLITAEERLRIAMARR